MPLTVRLIFWGLIGFVPNTNLQNGMTALLAATGLDQGACHVPPHASQVLLLDGECKGDCLRGMATAGSAVATGIGPVDARFKLNWMLNGEHLEVTGGEPGVNLALGNRPKIRGHQVALPATADQASDFSWVPDMDVLSGGKGGVNDACLAENVTGCPIVARFKIKSGRVMAGHLLHKIDPAGTRVSAFDFFRDGVLIPDYEQAVADAVLVEMTVGEDHVDLVSSDYAKRHPNAVATLSPAKGRNVITVLIGQVEDPTVGLPAACIRPLFNQHSQVFFKLLSDPTIKPAIRKVSQPEKTAVVTPGACENDFIKLAPAPKPKKVKKAGSPKPPAAIPVAPHTSLECDTRQFLPSSNG